jgi:hypothetical protein
MLRNVIVLVKNDGERLIVECENYVVKFDERQLVLVGVAGHIAEGLKRSLEGVSGSSMLRIPLFQFDRILGL